MASKSMGWLLLNSCCSWVCADMVVFSESILALFYIKVLLVVGVSMFLIKKNRTND